MIDVQEENPGTNELVLHPAFLDKAKGFIKILGRNNRIVIEHPNHVSGFKLTVTGDNHVTFGEAITFNNGQAYNLLAPGTLQIGARTSFNSKVMINIHEPGNIIIGEDCLFASDVMISCSHVHKIIDRATGKRVNPAGDITIADHVWVSARASLFGGAQIGRDTVIGHSTYVSGSFPPNCVVAGSPAKIIRSDVTWEA